MNEINLENLEQQEQLKDALLMFDLFFPFTATILRKEKFDSFECLTKFLLSLNKDIIIAETGRDVLIVDEISQGTAFSNISLTLDTGIGRFNNYRVASWVQTMKTMTKDFMEMGLN
ncbi:MAG: hypothetical protein ACRC92_21545 [Peptostreptococcaceae bacterium]